MPLAQTENVVSHKKAAGRVYTPGYIVSNILNLCEYGGVRILWKHIIDNSCGDGAFLVEAVRRYCEAAVFFNLPRAVVKRTVRIYSRRRN